jgi:hypothetical protein
MTGNSSSGIATPLTPGRGAKLQSEQSFLCQDADARNRMEQEAETVTPDHTPPAAGRRVRTYHKM